MEFNEDEIVDQYYWPDPETEAVLIDGSKLSNGMVVLAESPIDRHPTSWFGTRFVGSDEDRYWAMVKNRWAKVTDLTLNMYGEKVYFVAVYSDGLMKRRDFDLDDAWIVKKDSIPEESYRASAKEAVRAFEKGMATGNISIEIIDEV